MNYVKKAIKAALTTFGAKIIERSWYYFLNFHLDQF